MVIACSAEGRASDWDGDDKWRAICGEGLVVVPSRVRQGGDGWLLTGTADWQTAKTKKDATRRAMPASGRKPYSRAATKSRGMSSMR
jgi:hypothetical protein